MGLGEDECAGDPEADRLAADAEATAQQPMAQNVQRPEWFMEHPADDQCHVLQDWEHVKARMCGRVAYLYSAGRFAEGAREAEQALAQIDAALQDQATKSKTGHVRTGGGMRKELLDAAARCTAALGQFTQAKGYIDTMEQGWPKMVPTDFGLCLLRGRVLQGCGERAEAAAQFQRCVGLRPTNIGAWAAAAGVYAEMAAAAPSDLGADAR